MRLARLHAPGDLRVDDVERPGLTPGAVRVEVAYTGICGSDLHEYESGPVPIRAEATNHELPDDRRERLLPKPMGHEVSGTVVEVADDVDGVAAGDRVTLNTVRGCNDCRYCADGAYHLCDAASGHVVTTPGFADELVVPATTIVPVPDEVPLRHATVVEPLSVSAHGVRESGLQLGDATAVFGAGPIGLGVVAWAKAAGARTVLVSEPRAARRTAAAALGADRVIDPGRSDVRSTVHEETDGGVDVAFEAAGAERTLTDALRSTAYGGTVAVLSVFEDFVPVHPNDIMQAERRLVGSFAFRGGPQAGRDEFAATLAHLADGRLDPEPMVSDVISLSAIEEGFERLRSPDSDAIKILVEP